MKIALLRSQLSNPQLLVEQHITQCYYVKAICGRMPLWHDVVIAHQTAPKGWGPEQSGPMASSFPGLRNPSQTQNPYKTRTKSDHFRESQFSNDSATIVYNFNALKCTDFLPLAAEVATRAYPLRSGRVRTILEFVLHNAPHSNRLRLRASGSSGLIPLSYTVQKRIKANKTEYEYQGPSQSMPTPAFRGVEVVLPLSLGERDRLVSSFGQLVSASATCLRFLVFFAARLFQSKTGQNGTKFDFQKIGPLRRRHLRRSPFPMSHFPVRFGTWRFSGIWFLVIGIYTTVL